MLLRSPSSSSSAPLKNWLQSLYATTCTAARYAQSPTWGRTLRWARDSALRLTPFANSSAAPAGGVARPFPRLPTSRSRRAPSTEKSRMALQQPVTPGYVAPRLPVVLCHGLFGFDTLGPASLPYLQIHYWRGIKEALVDLGASVHVTRVSMSGSIADRAAELDAQLKRVFSGQSVNLVGHSMGGLDGRYLISHLRPTEYQVKSLSTVCTPHRGSPFMDWCRDIFGVGTIPATQRTGNFDPEEEWYRRYKQERQMTEQSSPTSSQAAWSWPHPAAMWYALYRRITALLDTPAYSNLTTEFCNQYFNPSTPNDSRVAYYSYGASYDPRMHTWSSLRLPYEIIKRREGPNDGLVSLYSARWGQYQETVSADHYAVTNPIKLTEVREWLGSTHLIAFLYSQISSVFRAHGVSENAHASTLQDAPQPVRAAHMAKQALDQSQHALASTPQQQHCTKPTERKGVQPFDAIEFYLRMGTHLYNQGY
ncbi:hypothetical protein H4R34_001651 [Dimargaris verticillata]|uniref:GPI inositol-deacylase n=1 Tax=Dimargaris verticillata TaxID=2761393 RepID=A0A9W8EEA9_9FUNG|nr:hypothetical protein H4R34_001651 [Dimargaris verticillata]